MKLLEKLLEIQKEVDSFSKDKKGFNYKYTTGDQVLNKIRPLMNEYGILLKQEVVSVDNTRIDYETKSAHKSEMFSSVTQKFTWIDAETGEREECMWHGNGLNDWDKGLGSALTYAERYFLLKFFHVPTDEDDNDARQGITAKPAKPVLKEGAYAWNKAVDAIASGAYTISNVKMKYRIKDENKLQLEAKQKAHEASENN